MNGIGKVYTTRIQKPHFCGLGVYEPEKVFFTEDPNGKVYVDDKIVKIVTSKDEALPADSVKIGDKIYHYVQIGNQLWIDENLDFDFDGLIIGAEGTPNTLNAWYYDNDSSTSNGLLYNGFAAKYMNSILPNGWRVPTKTDFDTLVEFCGGTSIAGKKLKNDSLNGTNDYHFDGDATGYRDTSGNFDYKTGVLRLWTSTDYNTNNTYFLNLAASRDSGDVYNISNIAALSVRLVKDV